MRNRFIVILFSIVAYCLSVSHLSGYAQNIPAPSVPPKLVNDFAGILHKTKSLEDSLVQFNIETTTQIAVVTVNDLEGYTSADYALKILREWGVGQKGKNNGIVVLLKPRNKYGQGEVYIAVGTGLEGVLNDAKAGRIIDNYMISHLKNGDYTTAVIDGTRIIREVVRGEFSADYTYELYKDVDYLDIISIIFIVIICMIGFIIMIADDSDNGNNHDIFGGGNFGNWSPRRNSGWIGGLGNGFGGHSRTGGGFGGFGGFGGGSGLGGGAGRRF